jgi:hypothetical protein
MCCREFSVSGGGWEIMAGGAVGGEGRRNSGRRRESGGEDKRENPGYYAENGR